MRSVWFLGGALTASLAAACFFLLTGADHPQAEVWHRRALEAEQRIAELRERLREVQARPGAPTPTGEPVRLAQPAPMAVPQDLAPAVDAFEAPDHWEALLDGVVEMEAERLGRQLDADQRQRLSQALKQVRSAAVALEDGGDPEGAREARMTRTLVMLRADRIVRELLGIGLSELVRDLDPGAVEEVPPVLE